MEKGVVLKKSALIGLVIFLTGCAVGPDYKRPPVAVPAAYKEAPPPGWKVANPQDEFDRGEWWKVFHDPVLNALENQVNVSNQNIAQAVGQFKAAVANIEVQKAAYFPTVTGTATYTRQKLPASGLIGNATNLGSNTNAAPKSNPAFDTYFLAGDATWVPDIWGSVRRSVESSRESAQASEAQIAATQLLMQGTLAQDYFSARALDSDEKLLKNTAAAYRKTYHLIQQRYKAGTAAVTDVMQALAQLKATEASAIDVGVSRSQFEHAIAVLIGKPPAYFSLPPAPLRGITPPRIPLQVPSALLERRPDIAVAERTMASNNALIGVAKAAYFPALTLTGTAGFQANIFHRLFNAPSTFWSLSPSLLQYLFDGGLRRGHLDSARATYEASVASYRQTVLAAFQNVEDNLAALRILQSESNVLKQDVDASRRAYQLTLNNYKQGTTDYTAVVVAQVTLLTAEKNYIDVAGRRMTSAVGLVMALGGGWDVTDITLDPPKR